MEIKFRIADASHIHGIVDLCNEVFEENTTYEEADRRYKENENDKNQLYIIGEIDGKIIAHTRVAIISTIFDGMETYAILNHVCVKPEYRKHKIATHMLEVVKKVCQERNCIAIKLWSRNFRVPAHTCYKKFGFVPDDATFFNLDIRK